MSFYVDWDPRNWETLTEKLNSCKHWAGVDDAPDEATGWNIGDKRLAVEPYGARSGGGRKGLSFTWLFTYGDLVRFRIVNRASVHKTMPNVFALANGHACTLRHAEQLYRDTTDLVECLGGTIRSNKLSRVDICLDMPGTPIDELIACFDEGRYICRANARGKMESNGVTIYFGETPIKVRIYDKLREVIKKADPIKTLAMQLYRWGGEGWPDAATRVEFQIRRDGLKERGIDSVEDYYERRASLIEYLTTGWLRMTTDPVDRKNKNQSKSRTLPLWTEVSARLIEWGAKAAAPLAPLPREDADVSQLEKQAVGVLRAAAGYQGRADMDTEAFEAYCLASIRRHVKFADR